MKMVLNFDYLMYNVYVTGEMDLSGKSVLPGLTRQNGPGTIFEAIYLTQISGGKTRLRICFHT